MNMDLISQIVFILSIFLLVYLLFRVKSSPSRKNASSPFTKWLLSIYGVVLTTSTILFFLLPTVKANLVEVPEVNQKVIDDPKKIYDAALDGRIQEEDGVIKKKQWEFTINDKQLRITFDNNPYQYFLVAEKKDTNDGKIEVIHYTTRSVFENIDITTMLKSPHIAMDGNTLQINNTMNDLNFIKMEDEFTISQFTSGKKINYRSYHSQTGHDILYMKIPSDVEIMYNAIQFVKK